SWAPGLRETDGIWARHWYGEVENSTGFRKASARTREPVPKGLTGVYDRSRECYDLLYEHRLR
ncbi:MAG TPA: hypothetical protein VJS88_05830, partial [Chthoniobacterales bacterium]|nr:hypothetical protein [Chthoniobacterales bacterium]